MTITRQLLIFGRVQGVFFRESMCRKARELEVSGWVRNRMDGTVEAMVQGTPEAVSKLIEWAHHGPDMARVDHVEVNEGHGSYAGFDKLPSV